eukprot:CAMPEP_0182841772 /NCGR_PEP_ID=MMETSP0006_2-20121128/25233_1 /TAXON_ID=97485 /ORGANISM="Prymnesium parvum, Strain Texoma1" /LENGTH=86 /DNA_ID=CAMNT_0024971321 /DNA_START=118 /DNA_END=375 /DNA_ORIENTATION=-
MWTARWTFDVDIRACANDTDAVAEDTGSSARLAKRCQVNELKHKVSVAGRLIRQQATSSRPIFHNSFRLSEIVNIDAYGLIAARRT